MAEWTSQTVRLKTVDRTAPADEDAIDDLRCFVTISRTHATDCGDRQIIVRLDGGECEKLVFGDSFSQEVKPGSHHLRVHNTLMWRNIRFAVEPGEHLEFIVINTSRWWTWGIAGVLGSAPLFLKVEMRSRV
jgi:hypothetical protein